MAKIKLLSENLINQIAAGEVIERPASIVKELLENSIDANASKIEIEIGPDCRNIRIADNGSGIDKDDAVLAFTRHATSKIKTEKDLWSISTLGFRGEALASIISVAKVSCITKTSDAATGIKVECENSEIKITETGCATGTVMEIKELFYNIPARMKFLKKPQTEFANIVESIQTIAISHPEISFHLLHKGHTTLKTTGSSDFVTVISEIYSRQLINELTEISKEDTQFKIKLNGFTSNPDFTRSNKKAIYVFINGRTVKCHIISKAIETAYRNIIPDGRYPFAVLNLSMPPGEVDVNVHPAKREVRYVNPNQIFNFVQSAVKSVFESSDYNNIQLVPSTEIFEEDISEKNNVVSMSGFGLDLIDFTFESPVTSEKIEKSIEFYSPPAQTKIMFGENKAGEIINKPKIIGQFLNTYILLENPVGLEIIDQHIAHERFIYEKLKSTKDYASQLLLTSQNIELEPSQMSLLEENSEILFKFGYKFRKIENRYVVLEQVPQLLAGKDPESVINDILESLEESPEHLEDKILITTACHAAVKAGEKLSIWQMEELITNWQSRSFSATCPHGRKISHILPSREIAAFFGRN